MRKGLQEGFLIGLSCYSQGREAVSRAFTIYGSAVPVAIFTLGQKSCSSNGQVQEMDVAPLLENGRTYVPLRYLAMALGVPEAGIGWDPASQTVTLSSAGHILKFYPGRAEMERDGRREPLDVALLNRYDRVFLLARYVAEALGYKVHWSETRQQVLVTRE
ncbi:copper amine oxidase N-terminal domain-containing protein [Moorella sp. E308F]|uniref:copper amine oxidase N-terminal domain-containing protein n=1 Tax=Moorella sp. E308F TaxID=2572682 RepID=UPI001C0F0A53|nr:copper amine oxidase N-terminal domain-containing protein [Moorella sp. E308F]